MKEREWRNAPLRKGNFRDFPYRRSFSLVAFFFLWFRSTLISSVFMHMSGLMNEAVKYRGELHV